MFSSSSTIRTRLVAICRKGQQHTEAGAAQFSFHQHDVAPGKKGALTRNGKPEAHSPLFERDGWLKHSGARMFAQPGAGIVHFDRDSPLLARDYAQDAPA